MNIVTAILTRLTGRARQPVNAADETEYGLNTSPFQLSAYMLSDRGCQRSQNQDRGCYLLSPSVQDGLLALVADGMGGHRGGEVASRLAAETICERYANGYQHRPQQLLAQAFRDANRRIYRTAKRNRDYRGMGTTCTALLLQDAVAHVAHIGDSRLYLIRDDAIYRLTEDHSLVMEMVKHGLLDRTQASQHQDKNVILRALGTKPKLDLSAWQRPLPVKDRDRFLLSTDGLHDLVSDDEIQALVGENPSNQACGQLVELAKQRGGHDNITVGLIDVNANNKSNINSDINATASAVNDNKVSDRDRAA